MNLTYLYNDGEFWHFMNNETSSSCSLTQKQLATTLNGCWISRVYRNSVEWSADLRYPPNFVELEIVDTDPGLKGDTAGTGGKPATLSLALWLKFRCSYRSAKSSKWIRSGEYVSREVMRLWCGLQAAPSLFQVRDDETPYRSCFVCQRAAHGL